MPFVSQYTPAEVLSLVKVTLKGVNQTAADPAVQTLINAVEGQIAALTGLVMGPQAITEWLCGSWSKDLVCTKFPVRSITNVYQWPQGVDNANMGGQNVDPNTAPDPLELGVDYWLSLDTTLPSSTRISNSGLIKHRAEWMGLFERKRGRLTPRKIPGNANINVVYAAGYPAGEAPPEFLTVVAAGVVMLARHLSQGGMMVTSNSLDGWSESYGMSGATVAPPIPGFPAMIGSTLGMIAPYLRPRIL